MDGTGERPVRIIRRYPNRKLYDIAESRYVTLQDVEALVQGGVDLRVVDHKTGEDVTQTALAQILAEAGRRRDPRYSLANLVALFRRPEIEERLRDFQRKVDDRVRKIVGDLVPLHKIDEEIRVLQRRIEELEKRLEQRGEERRVRASRRRGGTRGGSG